MLCRSHDFEIQEANEKRKITEGLENMEPLRGNSTQMSFEICDKYREYFLTSEGAVPWQYEMVRRGRTNV